MEKKPRGKAGFPIALLALLALSALASCSGLFSAGGGTKTYTLSLPAIVYGGNLAGISGHPAWHAPLSGIVVDVKDGSGKVVATATTNSAGVFSVQLPDGTYSLAPRPTQYLFSPTTISDIVVSGMDTPLRSSFVALERTAVTVKVKVKITGRKTADQGTTIPVTIRNPSGVVVCNASYSGEELYKDFTWNINPEDVAGYSGSFTVSAGPATDYSLAPHVADSPDPIPVTLTAGVQTGGYAWFDATFTGIPTYTLSGKVSWKAGAGSGALPGGLYVDIDKDAPNNAWVVTSTSTFTFTELPAKASYTVTPRTDYRASLQRYKFTPTSRVVDLSSVDASGVDFEVEELPLTRVVAAFTQAQTAGNQETGGYLAEANEVGYIYKDVPGGLFTDLGFGGWDSAAFNALSTTPTAGELAIGGSLSPDSDLSPHAVEWTRGSTFFRNHIDTTYLGGGGTVKSAILDLCVGSGGTRFGAGYMFLAATASLAEVPAIWIGEYSFLLPTIVQSGSGLPERGGRATGIRVKDATTLLVYGYCDTMTANEKTSCLWTITTATDGLTLSTRPDLPSTSIARRNCTSRYEGTEALYEGSLEVVGGVPFVATYNATNKCPQLLYWGPLGQYYFDVPVPSYLYTSYLVQKLATDGTDLYLCGYVKDTNLLYHPLVWKISGIAGEVSSYGNTLTSQAMILDSSEGVSDAQVAFYKNERLYVAGHFYDSSGASVVKRMVYWVLNTVTHNVSPRANLGDPYTSLYPTITGIAAIAP